MRVNELRWTTSGTISHCIYRPRDDTPWVVCRLDGGYQLLRQAVGQFAGEAAGLDHFELAVAIAEFQPAPAKPGAP